MILNYVLRHVFRRLVAPVIDKLKLSSEEKILYNRRCKELSKDEVLQNELNKLENDAKNRLLRKTKSLEDIAFYRGMLYYRETLQRNLESPEVIIRK